MESNPPLNHVDPTRNLVVASFMIVTERQNFTFQLSVDFVGKIIRRELRSRGEFQENILSVATTVPRNLSSKNFVHLFRATTVPRIGIHLETIKGIIKATNIRFTHTRQFNEHLVLIQEFSLVIVGNVVTEVSIENDFVAVDEVAVAVFDVSKWRHKKENIPFWENSIDVDDQVDVIRMDSVIPLHVSCNRRR